MTNSDENATAATNATFQVGVRKRLPTTNAAGTSRMPAIADGKRSAHSVRPKSCTEPTMRICCDRPRG